jgi:predicted amidohydrolase YtcJ
VLISEGDAFLIMHMWELYPGLGHQLSKVVRTLRAHGITAHHLEAGSWHNLEDLEVLPALVEIVTRELRVMRAVAEEVELEVHQTGHTGIMRGFGP